LTIDVNRSTITVHVGKAGLLSAAGHDHWVSAPISSGSITESPAPAIEFTIETARMMVRPDPKVSARDQIQIQKDMEEMTLESKTYPQITFRSTRVESLGDAQWRVTGDLSLHGITRPVILTAKRSGDVYSAQTVLRQTDFGIKPVNVGGGIIKVRNQVEIDFQIFARPR